MPGDGFEIGQGGAIGGIHRPFKITDTGKHLLYHFTLLTLLAHLFADQGWVEGLFQAMVVAGGVQRRAVKGTKGGDHRGLGVIG